MTDKTTTTTIPAGSITVGMVTAGAEEVANYYDDGNDLRHREVARFVFQAMQRAAPSPAAAAPSARFATPDAVVAEVWRHLPKTPSMWEVVESMSPPPLWLYEAMDKALTLLPAAPSAAQPVAWMCEDLILPDDKPLFTQVREHAERRAEAMHEGKPAWRVTPLYAAAPGAQPSQGGSVTEAAEAAICETIKQYRKVQAVPGSCTGPLTIDETWLYEQICGHVRAALRSAGEEANG